MNAYVPEPGTWAIRTYDNQPNHLVTLSPHSQEFIDLQDHFEEYEIISIERVQNRYQYGRFLIYKLQKGSPTQQLYFMPLRNTAELTTALRYNCDYRRLHWDADPFHPTPTIAAAYCGSYNKLLVVEGLRGYLNHDSGRYPKYVVTYEQRK